MIYRTDFLKNNEAEKLYHFLSTMNEDWWYNAMIDKDNEINLVRRYAHNKQIIENNRNKALDVFKSSQFSYRYDRTIGDHCEDCKCKLCDFSENFINSSEFINWVESVTNHKNLSISHHFFTRYSSGDFLYPHTDDPNGKVAIVINLSKNWKPIYGGHLHVLDENGHIKDVYEAIFNTASIMDIQDNNSPHFVSFVAPDINIKRYGLVIWLK